MKIYELVSRYIFHDSLIEEIYFNETDKTLNLIIELCNWKQSYYKETDAEMLSIKAIFNNVTNFVLNPEAFTVDSDEILEVEFNQEDTIKFIIYNEEIKTIEVTAENVDLVFQ